MAVNLSFVGGAAAQFFDNSGNPLTGGKLYTYAAGTTTPQTSYTTSAGNVAHTNPIILDSAGRVPGGEIWVTASVNYKFVLTTAADVLIGTYDNIQSFTSNAADVVYNPAGNNAVATSVQDKLRQTVSVKDFGAVGNGVIDDTVAIQNAINACRNTLNNGGGVVLFPPGDYRITNQITIKQNLILDGQMSAIRPEMDSTKSCFYIESASGFQSQIVIKNFYFTSNYGNAAEKPPTLCKHFVEFKSTGGAFSNVIVTNIKSTRIVTMKSVVGFTDLQTAVSDGIEVSFINVQYTAHIPFVVSFEKKSGYSGYGQIGHIWVHHIMHSYRCTTGPYFYDMDNPAEDGRGLAGAILLSDVWMTYSQIGPWLFSNPNIMRGVGNANILNTEVENAYVELTDSDKVSGVDGTPYMIDCDCNNAKFSRLRLYYSTPSVTAPRIYYGNSLNSIFENGSVIKVNSAINVGSDFFIEFLSNSLMNEVKRLFVTSDVGGVSTSYPNVPSYKFITGTLTNTSTIDPNMLVWGTFAPEIRGTTVSGTGTYTTQIGRYQRIGNFVLFYMSLTWTAHTGTGDMIANLGTFPWTPIGTSSGAGLISLSGVIENISIGAGKYLDTYNNPTSGGTKAIEFVSADPATGISARIPMDTAGSLYISGFVEVN